MKGTRPVFQGNAHEATDFTIRSKPPADRSQGAGPQRRADQGLMMPDIADCEELG